VTVGVEIDADRIATAVQADRHIAGLGGGRYGDVPSNDSHISRSSGPVVDAAPGRPTVYRG